jgi:hypothetical protein
MEKVNIFVGRFQPFTAGHYKCVEEAYDRTGLPTVICMMKKEEKLDKKNPFPTSMLVSLYNNLFNGDDKIAAVVPVSSANIVAIGEELRNRGYEIAAWTCGTDRFATYDRMSTNYHEKAGLSDDFQMVEIKRDESSPDNISATMVRNSLLNNDRAEFDRLTPAGTNKDVLFNTLKSQIYRVYGIPENYKRFNRRSTLEDRVFRLERMINNEMLNKRLRRLENLLFR